MGLTWAVLWAPFGLLLAAVVDPDGSMDEPWVAVGAYPGFLGGVAFAVVLGIVGRRRRFDQLSVRRFAAWGAGAGLLVGVLWLLAALTSDPPRWALGGAVVGSLTLLSAVSAASSLALARLSERQERLDPAAPLPELDAGLSPAPGTPGTAPRRREALDRPAL
jgi:hypothetical protein